MSNPFHDLLLLLNRATAAYTLRFEKLKARGQWRASLGKPEHAAAYAASQLLCGFNPATAVYEAGGGARMCYMIARNPSLHVHRVWGHVCGLNLWRTDEGWCFARRREGDKGDLVLLETRVQEIEEKERR